MKITDVTPMTRADRNNNPAAITTDIAHQAGLILGTDYMLGDPFPVPSKLYTARLIGNPIELTIKVIDAIGYYTHLGFPRWAYICMPKFIWDSLSPDQKLDVVGFHYRHEGGDQMQNLFPNYSKAV